MINVPGVLGSKVRVSPVTIALLRMGGGTVLEGYLYNEKKIQSVPPRLFITQMALLLQLQQ